MYIDWHARKVALFLSEFDETNFLDKFFLKIIQISNFMKIRPVLAELFHADRRTNRHDEANSSF